VKNQPFIFFSGEILTFFFDRELLQALAQGPRNDLVVL